MTDQLATLARYNLDMNAKLYDRAATLSEAELQQDRGAFFGSILGTLNHIAVGDTLWLKRFIANGMLEPRGLLEPTSLSATLFTDLASLRAYREYLDGCITELVANVESFPERMVYSNTAGVRMDKNTVGVLLHFFNHQTHHRGQITTLLSQAGVDVGTTDLVNWIE